MRNATESIFILSMIKRNGKASIVLPTPDQDMHEHWDVEIDALKYEVKGRKHVNRHDKDFTSDIHVELRNVRGDAGWIKGKADYFAFEQDKQFLVVARKDLYKQVADRFTLQNKGKDYYQAHTRPGRLDIVTLVPLADVTKLPHYIIKKFGS